MYALGEFDSQKTTEILKELYRFLAKLTYK